MPGDVRTRDEIAAAADDRGALESGGANLRPCPDCGRQVSRLAPSCPSCGRPFAAPARAREGPFLQTLNAGCLLAGVAIVLFFVGGFILTVFQVLEYVLKGTK